MLLTVPCKVQPSYEITFYHLINTYSQNRMLPSPHIFSCIQAEKKKKKSLFPAWQSQYYNGEKAHIMIHTTVKISYT